MFAVNGYYDGKSIKLLEKIKAKPNQRVIITVMDTFVEPNHNPSEAPVRDLGDEPASKLTKPVKKSDVEELMGILSKYADPKLRKQEEGAWERAVVEKYGNI